MAYAIVVEEYGRLGEQGRVPLHVALNHADELLGLPVAQPENGDAPAPSVDEKSQAAQNDRALAELTSMMSGLRA